MSERVISNASPLVFLAKIGRLELLVDLFAEVLIPSGAWDEATRKQDTVTHSLYALKESGNLTVFSIKNEVVVSAMIGRLHKGEVEAIVGAGEMAIQKVILDDGYARGKAKQLGLDVTGTLGLLIAGYRQGLVDDLHTEIEGLMRIGFRISDSIVKQVMGIEK